MNLDRHNNRISWNRRLNAFRMAGEIRVWTSKHIHRGEICLLDSCSMGFNHLTMILTEIIVSTPNGPFL